MALNKLIETADILFSLLVRVSRADFSGFVSCYTCTERRQWKELQCGHFIRRGYFTVRLDKRNARPQCQRCNEELGGRPDIFEECLREELGDNEVDNLITLSRQEQHFTEAELREIIAILRKELRKYGIM